MHPRIFRLLLILIACAALMPSQASAYRTAADLPEFPATPVAWRLQSAEMVKIGVEEGSLVPANALSGAITLWNDTRCTGGRAPIQLAISGVSESGIEVQWVTDWASTGYPAREAGSTAVRYEGSGAEWSINGATIALNANLIVEQELAVDVVLAHEIGHALGLLHACRSSRAFSETDENAPVCAVAHDESLMHPLYDGAARLSPSRDDIRGICWLYPDSSCEDPESCMSSPGAGQLGDACTRSADCTTLVCSRAGLCSERCVRGACGARHTCEGGVCEPAPTAGGFDDMCESGAECASGVCLISGEQQRCTRDCAPNADPMCPGATSCGEVDGRAVCVAPPAPSCAVSAPGLTQHKDDLPTWTLALLIIVLLRRTQSRTRFNPRVRSPSNSPGQ